MFQLKEKNDGTFFLVGEPPVLKSDVAVDDSDKTFTVPAGKIWHILHLLANLTTQVTVGNRQLEVWITDASDNVLAKYKAGAVQANALTYDYIFAPELPRETSVVANSLMTPISSYLVLPAGYKVRVFDSGAVAPTTDDLILRMLVEEADAQL